MQSVAVREQGTSHSPRNQVNELLVLWQHPESREIIPIGRFTHDGGRFGFSYTRAAAQIDDFRPLRGLSDLRTHYVSDDIPAVFNQRVMSPDRPDYGQYLGFLGLDVAAATPWEQIVESGGDRAGDTLQFMQLPTISGGRAHARFFVNGIRHIPGVSRTLAGRIVEVTREEQETALNQLEIGHRVLLEPELENPRDAHAILVTVGGTPVGWVPRVLSASLRQITESIECTAAVHRIRGATAPFHLRLVLDLDVAVPKGFEFDPEEKWATLSS